MPYTEEVIKLEEALEARGTHRPGSLSALLAPSRADSARSLLPRAPLPTRVSAPAQCPSPDHTPPFHEAEGDLCAEVYCTKLR